MRSPRGDGYPRDDPQASSHPLPEVMRNDRACVSSGVRLGVRQVLLPHPRQLHGQPRPETSGRVLNHQMATANSHHMRRNVLLVGYPPPEGRLSIMFSLFFCMCRVGFQHSPPISCRYMICFNFSLENLNPNFGLTDSHLRSGGRSVQNWGLNP